jgi:hypothetical protein
MLMMAGHAAGPEEPAATRTLLWRQGPVWPAVRDVVRLLEQAPS